MPAPIATFIPDILEEHIEELAFLWEQRQAAVRDPRYTIRELAHLEERITAHLQGVLAVGEVALPLLEATLSAEDPHIVFAAAYALLHARNDTATARVRDSFGHAQGPVLAALQEALAQAPLNPGVAPFRELFHGGPAPVGAAAGTILAFHSVLEPTIPQIERLLRHEDAVVRQSGWRLVGYLGVPLDATPDEFEAEFQEEVTLPDLEVAQRHWKLVKPVFQQACRLRRGFDVGGALTPEVFGALDMESRWEILLRARFQGKWSGSPLRLERFPQGS